MSVKRYDLVGDIDGNCNLNEARMESSEDGVYVKHRDYVELEQQLAESHRALRVEAAAHENTQMQLEKMAAENAGLKSSELEEIEVINRGGQAYCVKDGMSVNPIYARGWNDYRAKALSVETPATDAYISERG